VDAGWLSAWPLEVVRHFEVRTQVVRHFEVRTQIIFCG